MPPAASPELRVELLNIVGWSLLNLEETAAAEEVVTQAVGEAARGLNPNHPQALRTRVLLAIVHRLRGRTHEMRAELDRVVPSLRKSVPRSSLDLIRALRNSANLEMHDGRYDAARSAAQEALDLSISEYGDHHAETATSWVVLALAHVYAKNVGPALDAASRAYTITLELQHGNNKHPRAIEARDLYGRALGDAGQPVRALEQLRQAAQDAAEVFGPSALRVGFISQHTAVCQLDVGEINQALESSRKACEIVAAHAKPDSYIYGKQLYVRGISLLAARKAEQASSVLNDAAQTFRNTVGPSHELTYAAQIDRALALGYEGKVDTAVEQLAPVLRQLQASKAESVSVPLHVMGILKRLAGDYVEALHLQQTALGFIVQGPRSGFERMRILTEIGLNQVELGQHRAAASSFGRALPLFESLQKRLTPVHADALVGLGRATMAQGNVERAVELFIQADRFWRAFDATNKSAREAAVWLNAGTARLGRTTEASYVQANEPNLPKAVGPD